MRRLGRIIPCSLKMFYVATDLFLRQEATPTGDLPDRFAQQSEKAGLVDSTNSRRRVPRQKVAAVSVGVSLYEL